MANESVNVSLDSNKKATKRGVYQKLSAEKKAEIGKRAAEHGVTVTVQYYASKLPEHLKESSVRTWKNVHTKEKQRLKEGKDSTTIVRRGSMAYVHAYTMKHTVGVAVWRGLAVGQIEP